ncbi:MAG: YjbH domain-containing protein, partial [Pseudomonadota bacterium]
RNAAGTPLCSVVLRPEGRAFVEAKRAQVGGRDESWAADPLQVAQSEEAARAALEAERLSVESLELSPRRARLAISNPAYSAAPTAVGRSAVALANTLPPSVEDLEITLVEGSLPVVTVSLRRARLEAIAETPDETRLSYAEARITDAEAAPPLDLQFDASYPRFSWAIGPSLPTSLFDPDNPVRLDVRLNVSAEVELTRGVFVDGAVRQRLLGNLDDITRESDSVLPRVRSDFREYLEQGDPGIERLKADVVRKIAPSTYARASAGLLESMYGGVSGEVLWKETDRNWGLGLEVNWVQQRDFDMLFAFRDYSVATGHASFYWDTNWNGMEFQLDAGRYLAEDWGGTFSLTRRFPNGWEVGGFFTLTDVPFDEFGEGSFDKGLRLRIPLRWGLPFESRSALTSTIRPLTRDGGQRLNVDRRLYEFVQDLDRDGLREDWGNFWR